MRATSGTVFAPDLLVAARGSTAAGSKRRRLHRPVGVEAADVQRDRHAGFLRRAPRTDRRRADGSTAPLGKVEISTPR